VPKPVALRSQCRCNAASCCLSHVTGPRLKNSVDVLPFPASNLELRRTCARPGAAGAPDRRDAVRAIAPRAAQVECQAPAAARAGGCHPSRRHLHTAAADARCAREGRRIQH